ncbi:LexA family protein [Klebsiella aerogenes]|nr:LexA family transcriptional regulator [Klebsiella aerogenes]
MNMKWYELAKDLMKSRGVSQETLAEHLGLTKGAVSHWLNSRREPGIDDIAKILNYLGLKSFEVNPDGTIKDKSPSNVSYHGKHDSKGSYPVISWVSAGEWMEAVEPYHRRAIDRWYETSVDCSDDSFWLDVKGDSMTSPVGLSIPEGTVILVDPDIEPTNGKLVVAKLDTENEATFKKLVLDAGRKFLKPLNPQYPMIEVNGNCRIVGVVVDAKITNLP